MEQVLVLYYISQIFTQIFNTVSDYIFLMPLLVIYHEGHYEFRSFSLKVQTTQCFAMARSQWHLLTL